MFANKFPTIDIGDYILREHEDKDSVNFYRYFTDPEVSKFVLTETPRNFEEARRELLYWKNVFYTNEGIYFTIADKKTDEMIGSVGVSTYSSYHNRIEISYDMGKEFWGKGIMSKAVKAMVEYVFETLNINRLEAATAIGNEASVMVLKKCGFLYEGRLRQYRYHRGAYVDVYFFSITRDQYFKNIKL